MDREQVIMELKEEIKQRFINLSEEEKNVMRENKNGAYAMILRQVLGEELLSGLNVRNGNLFNKGGIANL
tara:strand:+ start:1096 stop:1305 length:210 start_codon:yes stop_codon:yes gene_type:complete